jgi:hypothetical protein
MDIFLIIMSRIASQQKVRRKMCRELDWNTRTEYLIKSALNRWKEDDEKL